MAQGAVREIADTQRQIAVDMTWEAVSASPEVSSDRPVSRRMEMQLASHYGWKQYWSPDPLLDGSFPVDPEEVQEVSSQ